MVEWKVGKFGDTVVGLGWVWSCWAVCWWVVGLGVW